MPLDAICRSINTKWIESKRPSQCVAVVHLYKYIKLIAALALRGKSDSSGLLLLEQRTNK